MQRVGVIKYLIDDRFSYQRSFNDNVTVNRMGTNSFMVTELFEYSEGITFEEVETRLGMINNDIETWVLYDCDGYAIEFELDDIID